MKLVVFSVLLAALSFSTAISVHSSDIITWQDFKIQFSKIYSSAEEEELRKLNFLANVKSVQEHNARYDRGEESYRAGINAYSDLSKEEAAKTLYNCYRKSEEPIEINVVYDSADYDLPAAVNWREKGAVTPVKDQARCGSCWAFSTTGVLEGAHFLKTGKLVSLSEENLVDCDTTAFGCHGGDPTIALEFIKKSGGIDTESAYPYTEGQSKCHFNRHDIGAKVKGTVSIPSGDEDQLKKAVATKGPISVSVDANGWLGYRHGVHVNKTSSRTDLNHAVLVVGYGTTEKGEDYWLIKNSWGSSWGLGGYMMLARNQDNMCGVATEAVYPTV